MKFQDIVRPGERTDLEPVIQADEEGAKEKISFITRVYDVPEDDDVVELVMPMDGTKLIVLDPGNSYRLFFYTQKGIYACEAEVVDRGNIDGVAVAVLEPLTELEKVQRREYFRYNTVVGMTARMLDDRQEALYLEKHTLDALSVPEEKCVIVDLSGGGMRFISSKRFPKGCLIHARFVLNIQGNGRCYDTVLRILYTDPVPGNPKNTEYRGQFLFLEGGDREDIIRFIFEEQRKERQRKTGN